MTVKGQSGTAVVQFCLLFPFFAMFVAFMLNVAAYIWEMVILVDAARLGAREAVAACQSHPQYASTMGIAAANRYLHQARTTKMASGQSVTPDIIGHAFSNWGLGSDDYEYFLPHTEQLYMNIEYKRGGPPQVLNVPVKFLTIGIPMKASAQEKCYFCLKNNPFLSFAVHLPKRNGAAYEVSQTILTFTGCS